MPSTQRKLNVHRVLDIEDLATATLTALLRENRVLGGALACMGFGAGLAVTGAVLVAMDFANFVNWPLPTIAIVSGALGAGAAITALSAWQWHKGERRLRKLEAKLYAGWYLQKQTEPLPPVEPETIVREAFGRRHIAEAQEKTEELLRRVMSRPRDTE
jgi:hypothetical protein